MTKIDTQPEALRLAEFLRARQSHLGASRFSLRDPEDRAQWDDYDKAAVALESLHSDLERVTNNRDMWKDQCATQAQQIAQDRADAARYRWLRRWKGQEHEPPFTVRHEIEGTLWREDLDAAIDAARAAASGAAQGDDQ